MYAPQNMRATVQRVFRGRHAYLAAMLEGAAPRGTSD